MQFFSGDNPNLYIAIALSVLNGLLMCFASYKFFQMIQLSGYKLKGYFIWLKDTKAKYVSRMILLSLLSAFCVLTTNALFNVYGNAMYSYIGLIFYFYFCIVFIINLYSAPKKIPLKNTSRMTRLNIAMFFFVALLSFFLIAISTEYFGFIKFGILCFVPLFVPLIVPFVHWFVWPLERFIISRYRFKAEHKLKKMPNLIRIGITGSFGKTSTKYILNTLLSQKYKVCMSPHSFNTLPGLSKVVNNYLSPDDEIMIAEMGARNVGDIKALCDFIHPKYGLITGVGTQHLLFFKTQENILKTKNELIESLGEDGVAFFNSFNEGSKKLYDRCTLKDKTLVGSINFNAKDIKYDQTGTTFTLIIDKDRIPVTTSLIGKHNVENILLCVAVALKLGLSKEQIVQGISLLKPIPHRLELLKVENGYILDDSYNASVEGSKVALEVLKQMPGKKVIVTPGLVELGQMEYEENYELGKRIAKSADVVVIVNKVNFEALNSGLEANGFDMDNVYQAETLSKAKVLLGEILNGEHTVLFENDLPDNYI